MATKNKINRRSAVTGIGASLGAFALANPTLAQAADELRLELTTTKAEDAPKTAKALLESLKDVVEVDRTADPVPTVKITNSLPSGYVITAYGAAFYYRRNPGENPEVVAIDNDDIYPGQTKSFKGTRKDCCNVLILALDVTKPSGAVEVVTAKDIAPAGKCIVVSPWKLGT